MTEVTFVAVAKNGKIRMTSRASVVQQAPVAKRMTLGKVDAATLYKRLAAVGDMEACAMKGFDPSRPMTLAAGRWDSVYFRNTADKASFL